ncbi:MAG: hypothetical protein KDC49_11540 [Saprospiraceae bacterium]|nr:hypothetical protein [Saprospiraceae bacterium]
MLLKILSALALISLLISLINVVLAFLKWQEKTISGGIIFTYLIVAFGFEATSYVLAQEGINNLFLFHVYALSEVLLLSFLFAKLPGAWDKPSENLLRWAVVLLILVNSIFIQKIDTFNSYGLTLSGLVVIFYCVRFFLKMIDMGIAGLEFHTQKWLVSGIFLAQLVSLVVLFCSNFILSFERDIQLLVWISRSLFVLLSKLIIAYSLIKRFSPAIR